MPPEPVKLPTLPEDWERALCIVAHPDDLEYGFASAIARWTSEGKQVSYLLATRGEAGIDGLTPAEAGPLREQEERDGAKLVGVDAVEFLDFADGVVEYGLPLRRAFARAIRQHKPQVVVGSNFQERFAGGFTNQADHRAVGLAALDASKDAGNRWIFTELLAEGLEPWSGVKFVCFGGSPNPTHGIDVSGFLDKGIASLRAHARYLEGLGEGFPEPEEMLTWIAAAGGPSIDVEHAVLVEVFEV